MRRTGLALAVLTLGVGPWLALPSQMPVSATASLFSAPSGTIGAGRSIAGAAHGPAMLNAPPIGGATGCSCRQVVVEASNVVEDADVRTGDAKFVNRSITYISPSFDGD